MPATSHRSARRRIAGWVTAAAAASTVILVAAPAAYPGTGQPPGTAFSAEAAPAALADVLPMRRFAACGAVDPMARQLVVFGGRAEAAATHLADAWRLDLDAPRTRPAWRRAAPAGAAGAPPPTRSCAAAWDSARGRLLVFGGWDGVTMRNGVWALDPVAGSWTPLCDPTSCGTAPSPRRAAAATYDPALDRLVVVGGLDGAYRNDVWTLSLAGTPQWSPLATTGTPPSGRALHGLVHDPDRNQLWLVGGSTSGTDLDDTWTLDVASGAWQQVTPGCPQGCPSRRSGHVLAYDQAADRLVLAGGLDTGTNVLATDAWLLDDLTAGPTWTPLALDSALPQPRYVPVGGLDPSGGRLVVFGGGVGSSAFNDTLSLQLDPPAPGWRSVAPDTGFTARDQASVVLSRDGRVTAFGGFGSGGFPGALDAGLHLADTWQLPLHGRRGTPPPPVWAQATPADPRQVPLAREGAAVAHDTRTGRVFLVGGLNGDVTLDDVWVGSDGADGPGWHQLCSPVSCGEGPQARWGAYAVWDSREERVVLFGGRGADGTTLSDTWVLQTTPTPRWQRVAATAAAPPARWSGAATYDPIRHRMVIVAGQDGADAGATPYGDTWALSLGGEPAWTLLQPTGAGPSPRRSPAFATVRPRFLRGLDLLVATGYDPTTATHHNDVWRLSLATADGAWEQLVPDNCSDAGTSPACRRSASAVWDPVSRRFVLLAGRDGQRFYGDVWSFDVRSRSWSPLAVEPGAAVPDRAAASAVTLLGATDPRASGGLPAPGLAPPGPPEGASLLPGDMSP